MSRKSQSSPVAYFVENSKIGWLIPPQNMSNHIDTVTNLFLWQAKNSDNNHLYNVPGKLTKLTQPRKTGAPGKMGTLRTIATFTKSVLPLQRITNNVL